MRLALMQDRARPGDLRANIALIAERAREAARSGASLLLTPELFVTGYAPPRLAEEVAPAELFAAAQELAAIARAEAIAIVTSLPGPGDPGHRCIQALVIGSDGIELARYDKVHLFGPEERAAFLPGAAPAPIVRIDGIRCAVMICYDIEFPEMVRRAALDGAELIVVPTALITEFPEVAEVLIPARAVENQLVVAYANHCGEEGGLEFIGRSVIAGHRGEILARGDDRPVLLTVDLPARPQFEEGPWYLEDRRPERYAAWATEEDHR